MYIHIYFYYQIWILNKSRFFFYFRFFAGFSVNLFQAEMFVFQRVSFQTGYSFPFPDREVLLSVWSTVQYPIYEILISTMHTGSHLIYGHLFLLSNGVGTTGIHILNTCGILLVAMCQTSSSYKFCSITGFIFMCFDLLYMRLGFFFLLLGIHILNLSSSVAWMNPWGGGGQSRW